MEHWKNVHCSFLAALSLQQQRKKKGVGGTSEQVDAVCEDTLLFYLFIYLFCGTGDWTQGCFTSALRPRPYFLYFILKPGLTKLWRASLRRERERETGRERARELRLAANPDPPVSASQSTGITSVRHHAWRAFYFWAAPPALFYFYFETGSH